MVFAGTFVPYLEGWLIFFVPSLLRYQIEFSLNEFAHLFDFFDFFYKESPKLVWSHFFRCKKPIVLLKIYNLPILFLLYMVV
jgi:hypothetical protein